MRLLGSAGSRTEEPSGEKHSCRIIILREREKQRRREAELLVLTLQRVDWCRETISHVLVSIETP